MENNLIPLGIDAGNGAFKLFGAPGGLELVSQVSTNGTQKMLSTLGLRKQKVPLQIANESGSFYVGTGAHDYGRPVENLDVDRFNGTPEMKALLHGSLTLYQQRFGKFSAPLTIAVGLPNEVLTGEQAGHNIESVKRWMSGCHTVNIPKLVPIESGKIRWIERQIDRVSSPSKRDGVGWRCILQAIVQQFHGLQ